VFLLSSACLWPIYTSSCHLIISSYFQFSKILTILPPRGVSYLVGSPIKNTEEDEPPWSICTRCWQWGLLPPGSGLENLFNYIQWDGLWDHPYEQDLAAHHLWAGSFRFSPRARCSIRGRPARLLTLEATWPIPRYQPRTSGRVVSGGCYLSPLAVSQSLYGL